MWAKARLGKALGEHSERYCTCSPMTVRLQRQFTAKAPVALPCGSWQSREALRA